MEDLERYQIAQEVMQEYSETEGIKTLNEYRAFINDKTQPVEPLKEKLDKYHEEESLLLNTRDRTKVFKSIFKEELSGTAGLDEAITLSQATFMVHGSGECSNFIAMLKRIKKDLETK